jgi:hypothetical protein
MKNRVMQKKNLLNSVNSNEITNFRVQFFLEKSIIKYKLKSVNSEKEKTKIPDFCTEFFSERRYDKTLHGRINSPHSKFAASQVHRIGNSLHRKFTANNSPQKN